MRRPTRLIGAVAVLLALAGCGVSAGDTRTSATAPGVPISQGTATAGADKAVPQGFEAVSRADLSRYLAALRAIAPPLAANDVEAWRQGVFVCYQIYAGKSDAEVARFALQAYRGVGADTARATAIVTAAKAHLCGVPALKEQWRRHSSPARSSAT